MAKRGISEDSLSSYTPSCGKDSRFDVEILSHVPVQYIKRRCARAERPVDSETGEKIRADRAMGTVMLSLARRPECASRRRADMTVKHKGPCTATSI
jgi:hypothetical protein